MASVVTFTAAALACYKDGLFQLGQPGHCTDLDLATCLQLHARYTQALGSAAYYVTTMTVYTQKLPKKTRAVLAAASQNVA